VRFDKRQPVAAAPISTKAWASPDQFHLIVPKHPRQVMHDVGLVCCQTQASSIALPAGIRWVCK
jgi:hypothetical protein